MSKLQQNKKLNTAFIIFKIILLFSVVLGIPFYVYLAHPEVIGYINSVEKVQALLVKNEELSAIVLVLLQIFQIAFFVIPGGITQMAAGYVFGIITAYVLTMCGIVIGTFFTYKASAVLGKDAVALIVGEERLNRFIHKFNSSTGFIIIFFMYLIPGLPKDILCYICGVSGFNLRTFLIITVFARTPAVICYIWMGHLTYTGSYVSLGIVTAFVIVLFIIGALNKEKIIENGDKWYKKLSKPKKEKGSHSV